jgi:hypothetical protein
MDGQLAEMRASAADTGRLVEAAKKQAVATDGLRRAGDAQASAGRAQASSMDKLKAAGETQAQASQTLAQAGAAQAEATRSLAAASSHQLAALEASAAAGRTQAEAARVQAAAMKQSAEAAIVASRATDRLAQSGQSQAAAVLQSLEVAKEANSISTRASELTDRPWVALQILTEGEPVKAQEWQGRITLSNGGHGPALLVQLNALGGIYKVEGLNLKDLGPCPSCQAQTIFTGQNYSTMTKIPATLLTDDQFARLNAFTDAFVIQARADYKDTFGKSHVTLTCAYYAPAIKSFTACNVGNSAN